MCFFLIIWQVLAINKGKLVLNEVGFLGKKGGWFKCWFKQMISFKDVACRVPTSPQSPIA